MKAPRAVTRGETGTVSLSVGIDWLAFTFPDLGEHWRLEVCHFLSANFGVSGWEEKRGWQGYASSARVAECIVAWGGDQQRGSVHVEVPGSICGACRDWGTVSEWLTSLKARLTRVDIAGDDFLGAAISVDWAVSQWRAGGFSVAGRPPGARLIDDLGSGEGRTLYVGKRENGKMARCYEKGRQLGDKGSRWCRLEVEWRAKDRVLPFDMLTDPARYLSGAFPCASMFAQVATKIKTVKERARITYARAVEVARQQCGRVVNAILLVTGGDVGAVVDALKRSGLPRRCEGAFNALTRVEGIAS